ncbi:MAG: glutathione S-transferase family protein [Holosporales bacterium]
MRTLYHIPLCPFSRKVRLSLAEKRLDHALVVEPTWRRREEFLEMNHAGQVPVLIDLNNQRLCSSQAIVEYLDEAYPTPPLIGQDVFQRAEVRRLVDWFDDKFNIEVTRKIVYEKALRRHFEGGGPDSQRIRQGASAIHDHLDYICWLADRRHWLAGNDYSLADIAAAAHLSCVDFTGHVPWEKYPEAKEWYARIKSRPTFRAILNDQMPGIARAPHYADLDF